MKNSNIVAFKWLNNILSKQRAVLILLIVFEVGISVVSVVYAFLFRNIIDGAILLDRNVIFRNVIFLVSFLIIQVILQALSRYYSEKNRAEIENGLKDYFFKNLLLKEFNYINDKHSGQWLNRITSDTEIVANESVACIPGLMSMFVRIIAIVGALVYMDSRIALVIIPGGIALLVLSTVFRTRIKQLSKDIQTANGNLRSYIQEQLENIMIIKSYGTEDVSSRNANELMNEHEKTRLNRTRFSTVARVGFSLAMNGAYILCGIYCAYRLVNKSISYGVVMAMMQLVSQVQSPLANISGYIPRMYSMLASAERLMEIDSIPFDNDEGVLNTDEINEFYENELSSFGFENMSFSYTSDDEIMTINNCNIEINKGDFVAVVGASGCGKSTLLKLMMSLYKLNDGKRYIKTDNEVYDLTAKYRKLFAYVPQGNQLMSGTIKNAVMFGSVEDGEQMKKALYLSNSEEFISEIPEGIEYNLKERGGGLSEGQLQRLSIARAIYSKRPVLLLDEATSALDQATRDELLSRIKTMTNMTVIMVTHNNDTLKYFDKIISCKQINEGEVVWTVE